jgi:hypothetical protein
VFFRSKCVLAALTSVVYASGGRKLPWGASALGPCRTSTCYVFTSMSKNLRG